MPGPPTQRGSRRSSRRPAIHAWRPRKCIQPLSVGTHEHQRLHRLWWTAGSRGRWQRAAPGATADREEGRPRRRHSRRPVLRTRRAFRSLCAVQKRTNGVEVESQPGGPATTSTVRARVASAIGATAKTTIGSKAEHLDEGQPALPRRRTAQGSRRGGARDMSAAGEVGGGEGGDRAVVDGAREGAPGTRAENHPRNLSRISDPGLKRRMAGASEQ